MELVFSAEGCAWPLKLSDQAPRTTHSLLRVLPMHLQLHTPKIAGSHIYWHAPFVEDVEGATHVLAAKTGAFIYWPVRQFLEITFAPLQAENAEITVLGELDAPIEGIIALADTLKHDQGNRILSGTLSRKGGEKVAAVERFLPDDILAARVALWQNCPHDIALLTNSRAIMHPVGPVMTAESEARVLHELLWWVRGERGGKSEAVLREMAAMALAKTATRLRDFCHMDETPQLLLRLSKAMSEHLPFDALINEAILCAGRIAAWLDLLIPWDSLNEAFRGVLARERRPSRDDA